MPLPGAAVLRFTAGEPQKPGTPHESAPLTCCDVKLVSVPDMGYNVTDTVHGQELDGDKVVAEEIIFKGLGRIRHVITGPDGALYEIGRAHV